MLGRQHADAIAAYGGIPVLLDLFQDPVEQLADDLSETHGVAAAGYAVDITQEQQVESNCSTVFGKNDFTLALTSGSGFTPTITPPSLDSTILSPSIYHYKNRSGKEP